MSELGPDFEYDPVIKEDTRQLEFEDTVEMTDELPWPINGLTVRQLIEKLSKYPGQDEPVVFNDSMGHDRPIMSIDPNTTLDVRDYCQVKVCRLRDDEYMEEYEEENNELQD